MRLLRITDIIITNLRALANTTVGDGVSGQERTFLLTTIDTANQILTLPEVPEPDDHTEEVTFLQTENRRLTTENTRLQATIDRLLAMPVNQELREARQEKRPDIPMFDGTRAKLQPWIDQFWLKIADERRYPTLQSQLVYAFSRCEGTALDHLRPFRRQQTLNFDSVQALIDVLEQAFEDPDRRGTARRTLLTLRQDSDDFPAFYAKFQAQVPHAGMDDGGLLAAMTEAVNPRIRDRMIGMDPAPETLAVFVTIARRIDAGFRAEKECKTGITHASAPPKPRSAPKTTTMTTATGTEAGPMDLSRKGGRFPRLSEQERQRRLRMGLCFRCGGQGHLSTNCPSTTSRPQTTVAAITTADPQEENSDAAASRELSEN